MRRVGPESRVTFMTGVVLGTLCIETGRFELAEEVFGELALQAERLWGPAHEDATNAWRSVAVALHERGEHADAVEVLSALLDREHEAGAATATRTEERLASCLRCLGREEEAEALVGAQ